MQGTAPNGVNGELAGAEAAPKAPEAARGERAGATKEPSRSTGAKRLLEAIKSHPGRHVVVIRGYPDPDSLASAWAHARLAATVGIECDIAHLPLVSRAENRAMVNLLDLPLTRITAPEDLEKYSAMTLVDANSIELPRKA